MSNRRLKKSCLWTSDKCCYYGLVWWEGRGRMILAEKGRVLFAGTNIFDPSIKKTFLPVNGTRHSNHQQHKCISHSFESKSRISWVFARSSAVLLFWSMRSLFAPASRRSWTQSRWRQPDAFIRQITWTRYLLSHCILYSFFSTLALFNKLSINYQSYRLCSIHIFIKLSE